MAEKGKAERANQSVAHSNMAVPRRTDASASASLAACHAVSDGETQGQVQNALLQQAMAALSTNKLLLASCAIWWCSHFLLLWNTSFPAAIPLFPGHDNRLIITLVGTVVSLGVVTAVAYRNSEFALSQRRWPFAAYALLAGGSYIVLAFVGDSTLGVIVGSLVSGLAGGLMHFFVGELHQRLGYQVVPLAIALESACGVVLFFALSWASNMTSMLLAAALAVTASVMLGAFSARGVQPMPETPPAGDNLTVTPGMLVCIAVLTGVSYGLVRSYTAAALGGVNGAMWWECLGSCVSIVFLLAIFFLQKRRTLFEQCLLFVIPFVAAGMLLVSTQDANPRVVAAVNDSGFATYFTMIWYFAAALACSRPKRSITLLLGVLFTASQVGQLTGALMPTSLDSLTANVLVYLLLLTSTFSIYWYARRSQAASGATATLADSAGGQEAIMHGAPSQEASETEQADTLREHFGLSPREAQIAMLLAQRVPYKAIGEQLFISDNTVKTHVRNIYRKMEVTSREELLRRVEDIAKKG